MSTYLDFDSTKSFRDYVISKTLQQPNGPQTFTAASYPVSSFNALSNIDPGDVETGLGELLLQTQNSNLYKPIIYPVEEYIPTIPRRANLELYPHFTSGDYSLLGIFFNDAYENESEMFKFADSYISENKQGPVYARIQQNLTAATYGRVRVLDALNGNTSTAINLITGREQIIEKNYKITVSKTLLGKGIDFVQTVAGVEFPWSEIPGDYLTNPYNPMIMNLGTVLGDAAGALGSLFGIDKKPALLQKPSDLMVDYMGSGQKQSLFYNLRISKYRPDYGLSARSGETSGLTNLVNQVSDTVTSLFGESAPGGNVYIGDDRGVDVKYAMGDFNDRIVKSGYYLSLMFDPIQAKLFQRERNISEGGKIGGMLTWYGKSSQNELGTHNKEYTSEQGQFEGSLSTNFLFREGSILGKTQEIINTMPVGGDGRTHVGNAIDQTSRFFRDGDTPISRGSAIKYVDKFNGEETGIEYCRVWTKDRSYMNFSDTMKRTGNIRKFDSSVMTTPWNLNIAPMSNGNGSFDGSSNIVPNSKGGFYAKKYMFSIENLAWKTSNTPGFTVQDLPYCERGNNDGRVMWFPPYDLKINEQNSAKWESNVFLGRPEPIYTYQNAERTGTISFKVVVDHPSILNLLVKDFFKDMSSEESENYINAFFAGCEELDFYGLIRRYSTLDRSDIENILAYLNKGENPKEIQKYKTVFEKVVLPVENTGEKPIPDVPVTYVEKTANNIELYYPNDYPKTGNGKSVASMSYDDIFNDYMSNQPNYFDILNRGLDTIFASDNVQNNKDRTVLFGHSTFSSPSEITTAKNSAVNQMISGFQSLGDSYNEYMSKLDELKTGISDNSISEITINITSSTSSPETNIYNFYLSLRRTYSVIMTIFQELSNGGKQPTIKWVKEPSPTENLTTNDVYNFSDFGYGDNPGKITIITSNTGENTMKSIQNKSTNDPTNYDCHTSNLNNTDLKISSPVTFYCRNSSISFKYQTKNEQPTTGNVKTDNVSPPLVGVLKPDGTYPLPKVRRPQTDIMQRIVMKTLSECHYFKMLEEDSPVAFNSLREKLRYFHPAFHSTTPEGLNSRLTFLLQCLRPGETIPIKGVSDENDLTARNTSFGPPPICVLRIGDFYHSKIIIRDVNITYDDTVWDLNPEGIGVQPMIANVSLQISFIGGHGMEKPVERLQNALTSNFYANTEMYDERSIRTNTMINGQKSEVFTKSFLEDLQKEKSSTNVTEANSTIPPTTVINGVFIGKGTTTLNYTTRVDNVYTSTNDYFSTFADAESKLTAKYGPKISSVFLSEKYRTINKLTVETTSGTIDLTLLGVYEKGKELSVLVNNFGLNLKNLINSTVNISNVFNLNNVLSVDKLNISNELLRPELIKIVDSKINTMLSDGNIKILEERQVKLIDSIDQLNFIMKYQHDGKIDGEKYSSASLIGFSNVVLYNEYSDEINYTNDNHSKLTNSLDNSFDFYVGTITLSLLSEFLSVLLSVDDKNTLVKLYENISIITPNDVKKIDKELTKFLTKPVEINIKNKKAPNRKINDPLTYVVTNPLVEITDGDEKDTLKKVFSSKLPISNKLNFYKP